MEPNEPEEGYQQHSTDASGNSKTSQLLKAEEESTSIDVPDGRKPDDEDVITIELDDENSSGGTTTRIFRYGIVGKKTAAQGLMDIALVTANANQLRYILEFNRRSHTFHITLSLIIFSIALQLALAMLLIFKGRYYVKGESKCRNAKKLNSYALFGILLITVVNIFIASLTTMDIVPETKVQKN